jgi:uncharacterized protein YfaS (alpha-2-macroglobulin family)
MASLHSSNWSKVTRWGWLAFALSVVACVTGSEVPKVATMHVLAPKDGETRDGKDAPFSVVHYGPEGDATSDAVINIVFSRAIRTLDGTSDTPVPVTLEPAVAGKWQWIGTNAVQFRPEGGHLPFGRKFQVSVSGNARSLDGQSLGKPVDFGFTTATPLLVSSSPHDGQRSVELRPRIVLDFNQPVDHAELERSVILDANGKRVAFNVESSNEAGPERVVLVPKTAFPRDTAVRVTIPVGLHSIGGDVPSPHSKAIMFHTYAPLTADVRCGWDECLPSSDITLSFSNPVKFKDIKQRVTITPADRMTWPEWYSNDSETSSFGIGIDSKARTEYRVTIAGGVKDVYGQTLQGPTSFTFSTGDYWDSLQIGAEGEIVQPATARALPIRSRNVPAYSLTYGVADPAFVINYHESRSMAAPKLPMSRVSVKPGITNRFSDHLVDLVGSLTGGSGEQARGAFFVRASYETRYNYESVNQSLLQVTDLGLTAKLSKSGTLVWVTKLSTGLPISGATVELMVGGKVTRSYVTDAQGFVVVPTSDFVPQFYGESRQVGLVVRHEGDWVAASEGNFIGPWRMPIYPELYDVDTHEAFLFTERGIYRPGDKVWVKGIVREHGDANGGSAGGLTVVSGRKYTVTLSDPSGNELGKHTVTTSDFGTFALQVAVPGSAELGTFTVRLGQDKKEVSTTTFAVAEYEPAEFAVNAQSSESSLVNGATARFSTDAAFLYGSPVANADVYYTLSYDPASFSVPNADDYDTRDDVYHWGLDSESPDSGMLGEGKAKLDAQGQWSLSAPLKVPSQQGPVNVRFETSVTDVSRKTLSGSALTLVHPASFYVGIRRPQDWFVDAPGTVSPQIAAFSTTGQRVSGKSVSLELIHRRWSSVKQQWEGGYRQVYQRVDDVVGRCTVTTATTDQTCSLNLTEGGSYLIRAKGKDEAGRTVQASQEFYAIGGGRVAWRDDAQNATMDIVPNKKVYRVGETARVLVKSPFTRGEALVTVERAGIIERRKVTLAGGTPVVEVPITDQMRPNAYVSVHLVKTRDAKAAPAVVGDELYRIGYAELKVDSSDRVLQVSVTPKAAEVKPGAAVEVDVLVRDANGKPKPAEVTFYAVDEGVLMLTGYRTPDPAQRFTQARPLQVATVETRADLARIFDPQGLQGSEKGAEGGGGGGDARGDFKQSAYFNPSLVTDEQGRARVKFQAPDNLTTFRLLAVAVSKDDRYGNGQSKVTVNKPLMARPALPRFLRAGDKFEAAVAVSTKGATSTTVDVSLEVGPGLVVRDDKTKQVRVTKEGTQEVRFKVEAEKTGATHVQFTVAGANERDVVRLTRTIQSPAQLEAVAAYGETKDADGQRLGKLEDVRRDVGGLDVVLSSSRLVGLDGSMEHLAEYPYLCSEQLSSRLLPLLPLRDLAKEFGFKAPADAKTFAATTVRSLIERQQSDGGFGFWPESNRSHPYVSAYALWTLKLAQRHGVTVSDHVFNRGISYLRNTLNKSDEDIDSSYEYGLSRDLQAFYAYVLAELGQPDLGAIERLFGGANTLGLPGHAWLSMAAVKSKAPSSLREPLRRRLESSLAIDGNRAVVQNADDKFFDSLLLSPLKLQALVLSALLTENPSHPLAGKMVTELLLRREGGTWRTTQESAFALLAIDQYWRAQEKEVPRFEARVWAGETQLVRHAFEGRSTQAVTQHIPMQDLAKAGGMDVVFERGSKEVAPASGTLFYEARLKYAPVQLPASELDRGFAVQKSVRSVSPSELAAALKTMGETQKTLDAKNLMVVDLLVVAPTPRRFVVVDDPLPAGVSAFDASLATSSATIAGLEESKGPLLTGFSEAWHRRELRDDRALFFIDEMPAGMYHYRYLARPHTPGTYVVPPTRVMEMYQPEVYGRTAAGQLTVVVQ